MNSTLENALTSEPVTVTLGLPKKDYPLAYPMEGVILYKRETAKLDRARSAEKRAARQPKLTLDEKREMRKRRRILLQEAHDLFNSARKEDAWLVETMQEFDSLLADANAITCALDEDTATGDSLFVENNWQKIDEDFERLLLALWVGTHQFNPPQQANTRPAGDPGYAAMGIKPIEYHPQLSLAELRAMCIPNLEEITSTLKKALRRSLKAPVNPEDEEPVPNVPAPATTTMPAPTMEMTETEQMMENARLMADTEIPASEIPTP